MIHPAAIAVAVVAVAAAPAVPAGGPIVGIAILSSSSLFARVVFPCLLAGVVTRGVVGTE
jgi:hypothetical protein